MLLLTRRSGESVFLTDTRTGEKIGEVKIIGVNQGHMGMVRIGFECPDYIEIVRDDAKPLKENADG
jgi:sRNA-binding carbon storage regulator CsrA